MKIVCLSDSFKGSLNSEKIGLLVLDAAKKVWKDVQVITLPIADGGEGTVAAIINAVNGKKEQCVVSDPLGRSITAFYGSLDKTTAVMEMAAAAGLPLLKKKERDPFLTGTYGVGEMLKDAIEKGYKKIYMGLGGSATNDCGMGLLCALGANFYDEKGALLSGNGYNMGLVKKVDLSQMDRRLDRCEVTILCDVENPLLGRDGAVYTFASQKGARDLEGLERNTAHFKSKLEECIKNSNAQKAGCGAAGGLGFCMMEVLQAKKEQGIQAILGMIHAREYIQEADLIITGEGRMDWQSAHGKAVSGVAKLCQEYEKPVIALVGSVGYGYEQMCREGIGAVVPILQDSVLVEEAMERAEEFYSAAAEQTFRILEMGRNLGK